MAAKKSPEVLFNEKPRTPCAADAMCRFPGRLWVKNLPHDQRLCINHYYDAVARDHSLADEDTIPPKTPIPRMRGVTAKAVAGE
jgi:hypothetical protein